MKTKFLKHRFLYLFILLSLTVSFHGCSDEDDEPQTFLETYDGTKWTFPGGDIYIRFIDDTSILLEEWYLNGDCYEYDTMDYEFIEFVENSTDTLIIKITDDGESETLTFTVQGEILKVVISYDGEDDTVYFEKSTINVDEFEICTN